MIPQPMQTVVGEPAVSVVNLTKPFSVSLIRYIRTRNNCEKQLGISLVLCAHNNDGQISINPLFRKHWDRFQNFQCSQQDLLPKTYLI